jgi:hypothetical protein
MSHRANVWPKGWFPSRACIGCFNMVVRAGRASVPPEPSNHWLYLEDHILMIGAVAFAASATGESAVAPEFYVVRHATTRKCTVADTKPATTSVTIVDNGTFKTRTEAETGMKTMKACTSN